MSPQIIIAVIIAASAFATGFGGAWKIQSLRASAKEADRVQQILADQRQSAATAIRRLDNAQQARDSAAIRDRGLRADAAGVRVALVGLRDAADAALRDAAASHAACTERATTLAQLLDTVASAGGELAGKADRHSSDAVMLLEAWPK